MLLWENKPIYQVLGNLVASIIVVSQFFLLYSATHHRISWWEHLFIFTFCFVITDFINGFVHMVMDNNDNYTSPAGPLVANFHLHHRKPVYTKHNLFKVYFNESGSKIWLAVFLVLLLPFAATGLFSGPVIYGLMYFSILSSLAEISHYLCHTSSSRVFKLLANSGLLLSKRRHGHHHLEDNKQYAFLNGMSDPLLDWLAKVLYKGYKTTTDLHYANYNGKDTENRR